MGGQGDLIAHDANPNRMKDLPERARRGAAMVEVLNTAQLAQKSPICDLVVVDAPCTGTGAWRRNPDAKWRISQGFIDEITALQAQILHDAAKFVALGGVLAYATCSILRTENADQIARFLHETPGWKLLDDVSYTPLDGGDGFYGARLEKLKN